MSTRPWFKMYPSDFLAGADDLTTEEKGAFISVLCKIYDRGGAIPNDGPWLGRICCCTTRRGNQLIRSLVDKGKLIIEADGKLHSPRAKIQIEKEAKEARELSENGTKGGRKSAENKRDASYINGIDEKGLDGTFEENSSMLLPDSDSSLERESALQCIESVSARDAAALKVVPHERAETTGRNTSRDDVPTLSDHGGEWDMWAKNRGIPGITRNYDANGRVSSLSVERDKAKWGIESPNRVNLNETCARICAAGLIERPKWRGDWETVVKWFREFGWDITTDIIPAIKEHVEYRMKHQNGYKQPDRLIAFEGKIQDYVVRKRKAAA